jgi:predicted kinase
MVFFASALTIPQAVAQHIKALQVTADAIEKALAAPPAAESQPRRSKPLEQSAEA